MNGYQVSFYTTLNRRVDGKQVKDWVIHIAREIGIAGATVLAGMEGYGHDRRFHAAHFFELADQPIVIVLVITKEQRAPLMARLRRDVPGLFHVIQPVEYGAVSTAQA